MKKMIRLAMKIFLAALITVSCDFPQVTENGEGGLTVVLPGESRNGMARSVLSNGFTPTLRYRITLAGPGETIERDAAGGSVTVFVRPGTWTVTVRAWDSAGVLAGTGSETVTVVPGKPAAVSVGMVVDAAYEASRADLYIHSEAELRRCLTLYGSADKTFYLENDISVGGSPAGILDNGTLDGQGHTVTLDINVDGTQAGFLGGNGGTVKNLRLAGTVLGSYSSGNSGAGAVAALNIAGGTIRNVASTVMVTALNTTGGTAVLYTGGIAGENYGIIEDCSAGGDVSATRTGSLGDPQTGGIAGRSDGAIYRCYTWGSWGSISSNVPTGPTGGIAGSNGGTIGNCAALNSKVNNTNTSMNYQGRISGFGSGTYSFNHAYALMQLDSYTTPISGSTATSSNGADIAATDLASSGSLTLWTGDSTKLDWPTFQTAATPGEPAGSPWHWYKTITIPANGISGSGIATAYVPALWFEE